MQEEIEQQNHDSENQNDLKFSENTKNTLAEIGKWGKFVGIIGFALCGLMLLVALALVFFGDAIGAKLVALGQPATAASPTSGIAYAVIAVLYYFPSKYIYDFSTFMQQGVMHNDQESVDYSFNRLRAFFKFVGTLAIILIGFYFIAFLMAMLTNGIAG